MRTSSLQNVDKGIKIPSTLSPKIFKNSVCTVLHIWIFPIPLFATFVLKCNCSEKKQQIVWIQCVEILFRSTRLSPKDFIFPQIVEITINGKIPRFKIVVLNFDVFLAVDKFFLKKNQIWSKMADFKLYIVFRTMTFLKIKMQKQFCIRYLNTFFLLFSLKSKLFWENEF